LKEDQETEFFWISGLKTLVRTCWKPPVSRKGAASVYHPNVRDVRRGCFERSFLQIGSPSAGRRDVNDWESYPSMGEKLHSRWFLICWEVPGRTASAILSDSLGGKFQVHRMFHGEGIQPILAGTKRVGGLFADTELYCPDVREG